MIPPWPDDWLLLRSASWTAAIDPQGAQLSVLRGSAGRDLLWDGDPAFWSGRAPILFPIVGELNGGHYLWRGQRYAMPRHGFARRRRFEVVHAEEREALFRLHADSETLRIYPFQFELDLAFRLEGDAFTMRAVVRNTDDAPMPASLGFHPAFRWPLPVADNAAPRGAHFIEFAQEEPAPVRRLDAQGLLTSAHHPTPVRGRRLALDDSLFIDDVLIFDQLRSRQLHYGADRRGTGQQATGRHAATCPRLAVDFEGATHLGVWTKPGAGFLCIEPWSGIADPVGFAGELDTKPGIFIVPRGASQSLQMRLRLDSE